MNNNKVTNNSTENNKKFFTFDEIYKARMAVGMSVLTMIFTIVAIIIFVFFMKQTQDSILDRVKERDVVVLTGGGAFIGKTTPILNEVAKQFALTRFTSTLIYDTQNPIPQLNFMRIYATPTIFKNYRNMVQADSVSNQVSRKLFYATLNTRNPMKIETLKDNEIFKITLFGERQIITNFSDANQNYSFKLELTIQKNNNTPIENMYGFVITGYNFSKI